MSLYSDASGSRPAAARSFLYEATASFWYAGMGKVSEKPPPPERHAVSSPIVVP